MIENYQLNQISSVSTVTLVLATLMLVLYKCYYFHGILSCLSAEIIQKYRSSSFVHFLISILAGNNVNSLSHFKSFVSFLYTTYALFFTVGQVHESVRKICLNFQLSSMFQIMYGESWE